MVKSITVSDDIYRRLELLAVGFDTPEHVIERLLNSATLTDPNTSISKPSLTFIPDEDKFKIELLVNRRAQVVLHFKNGSREVIHWNASRFQRTSNLRANLWSGFLRNWKERGITSASLSVLPLARNEPGDTTEQSLQIAETLGWTLDEVEQYLIEIDVVQSDDGCPYYCLATFDEQTPQELKEIGGFNSSNQIQLDLAILSKSNFEDEIVEDLSDGKMGRT